MKAKTLQILWHGKDPVLTLDFHPSGLLATGGADKDVRLWHLERDGDGAPVASFQTSLSHHTLPVNIVRFSPTGELLASGGDGGELMLWKAVLTTTGATIWKVVSVLKNHTKDVSDLCWSVDGSSLVSASVDNSCIIWDVAKGSARQFLEGHQHFVQGVAWDPLGHFIVSQSADRSCRVYASQLQVKGKQGRRGEGFVLQHTLAKRETAGGVSAAIEAAGEGEPGPSKPPPTKHHMFQDENMPSFFRRLAWSPDGSFLITPAGLYKHTVDSRAVNTSYIYSRKDWSSPVMHLPGATKSVVAARFCPRIFRTLQPSSSADGAPDLSSALKLPYRLVYAVATLDSLFLYDTQRLTPICLLAGLHYAAISDIAWSADAQYLAIASQDGYCTVVAFEDGELGELMPLGEMPPHIAEHLPETCRLRGAEATAAEEREGAAAHPRPASEEERTPSPNQQPRVTPTDCHVEPPAKRPLADGDEVRPPKQARRITPIASAPSENTLEEGGAVHSPLVHKPGVNALEKAAAGGNVPNAPRRITPVASAPSSFGTLLSGEGEVKEESRASAKPVLNPGAAVNPPKQVTVTSAAPPSVSPQPPTNPSAVPQQPKRIAPVSIAPANGAESKKRRITPVSSVPTEGPPAFKSALEQTLLVPKPLNPTPLESSSPPSGDAEGPKPADRISPSVSPEFERAAQTTPVRTRPANVSTEPADVSESRPSPPARTPGDLARATPDGNGPRPGKPIRRISPSPCKPSTGLEELARSANVEIARALSIEPVDGQKKEQPEVQRELGSLPVKARLFTPVSVGEQ